jgi:hypothetical protein
VSVCYSQLSRTGTTTHVAGSTTYFVWATCAISETIRNCLEAAWSTIILISNQPRYYSKVTRRTVDEHVLYVRHTSHLKFAGHGVVTPSTGQGVVDDVWEESILIDAGRIPCS